MAKNMAQITDGIVTNVLWCSDRQEETESLKHCGDKPIAIGDTYADGEFYRDGEAVKSDGEQLVEALRILGVNV